MFAAATATAAPTHVYKPGTRTPASWPSAGGGVAPACGEALGRAISALVHHCLTPDVAAALCDDVLPLPGAAGSGASRQPLQPGFGSLPQLVLWLWQASGGCTLECCVDAWARTASSAVALKDTRRMHALAGSCSAIPPEAQVRQGLGLPVWAGERGRQPCTALADASRACHHLPLKCPRAHVPPELYRARPAAGSSLAGAASSCTPAWQQRCWARWASTTPLPRYTAHLALRHTQGRGQGQGHRSGRAPGGWPGCAAVRGAAAQGCWCRACWCRQRCPRSAQVRGRSSRLRGKPNCRHEAVCAASVWVFGSSALPCVHRVM